MQYLMPVPGKWPKLMPVPGKWPEPTVTITDEAREPRFELCMPEGPAGPAGGPEKRLALRAPGGGELAVFETPPIRLYTYDIIVGGEQAAGVVHRMLPRPHYELKIRNDQLRVRFKRPQYAVGSEVIRATVLKGAWPDKKLAVKITDGEDPVVLLAVVVAIELAHYNHVQYFLP
jgi:hypothetical protein